MIEILRWKKKSDKQGGIIVGKVVNKVDEEGNSSKPKEIDKVFAESDNGEKYEAFIEADGFYRIEDLKKGGYKVFVNLPDTLTTYGDKHDFNGQKAVRYVNLEDNFSLIEDFSIIVNSLISGKVLDSNGLPVSSININLLRIEEDEIDEEDSMETDSLGNFVFKGLSEGKYLLRVGTEDQYVEPNSLEIIYPTTFFPNTNNKTTATIIDLNEAQVLENQNITLLPKLKKRILTGTILMPDGNPAPSASVSVQIKRKDNDKILRSGWYGMTKTNATGNFSLDIYEDTEYLVNFYTYKKTGEVTIEVLFSSECFTLPLKGEIEPLKITLKKGNIKCVETKFGF